MALTRIDIIDAALLRIGSEPIHDDGAAGGEALLAIYQSVTGYCLSAYPWTWNRVVRRLVRLSDPPVAFYAHQFDEPDDMLGAPRAAYASAGCHQPLSRWERLGGKILADVPDLWIEMDKRSEPTAWPAYFAELVQVAIMAEFALSIREDRALYDRLHAQVFGTPSEMRQGGMMGVAMNADAQSKPSEALDMSRGSNPLLAARSGG
ncbi:MAG TPA: hypothetical protein PK857_00570 [Hyphomicrobium sp.]|nr:hypothetical protein [Hyphomicrobium sp.]HRO48766.1 hypothetical protein [Hyphomicrobium sp.]